MHTIEPHYSWKKYYDAQHDMFSPFYGVEKNEYEFTNTIYNHYIHPQWDAFGSATLYLKVLFANYDRRFAIIELIGEWNDCLYNDIMELKRNVIEVFIEHGINKFILIGENVLNFHASDDSYYQEWFEDVEDGWIIGVNFRDHVIQEFKNEAIDIYLTFDQNLFIDDWRGYMPEKFYEKVESLVKKRFPVQ